MSLPGMSNTEVVVILAFVVVVVGGILVWYLQKRHTEKLRAQFGSAEYERAGKEGGDFRRAEARLEARAHRVESFHIRPLSSPDRARFVDVWTKVQAHFVDAPAGAVSQADQLLGDVMAIRGYPVGDFEQRAADISVDHPIVTQSYRAAHDNALRQIKGQANTEDLRRAMIHYRALFEDLVGGPREIDS